MQEVAEAARQARGWAWSDHLWGWVGGKLASERGASTVFVGLLLVPLLAIAAFALDVAQLYATRAQLQTAADAAVTAAANQLPDGWSLESSAIEYAAANDGGHGPILTPGDVDLGFWDAATSTFYPGGSPTNAVQVTTRRAQQNANPVSMFFAGAIGVSEVDVKAVAIAARDVAADVVIVQDVTVSFQEEMQIAVDADKALIDTFAEQYAEGVHMGVVSFARSTTDVASLTVLSSGPNGLRSALDGMAVCTGIGSSGGPCYGTDLGIGIDRAREMLLAQGRPDVEPVIVLVSDGLPCFLEESDPVGTGQVAATAAADQAAAAGISIFAITLYEPSGSSHPCLASDVTFNESLARGIGFGTTTTNPANLEALLISIIDEMPIRLVR